MIASTVGCSDKIWAAVHFNSFAPAWDYAIRYNTSQVPGYVTEGDLFDLFNRNPEFK